MEPKNIQSNPSSINNLSSQNKSRASSNVSGLLKGDPVHDTRILPNVSTEEAGWDFDFDDEESPVNHVENTSNNLALNQNNLANNSLSSNTEQNMTFSVPTSKANDAKQNGWRQWDEEW
jgi:hypothetical protein